MLRKILNLLVLWSMLLSFTPKDWLHIEHENGKCGLEQSNIPVCAGYQTYGICSDAGHFESEPESCLLLDISALSTAEILLFVHPESSPVSGTQNCITRCEEFISVYTESTGRAPPHSI